MNTRGLFVRALIGLGLVIGAVLALASSVVLHGMVLVLVAVMAALAACVAYGIRDDGRQPALDAAWKAAAGTVAVTVLISGVVVLAGGSVAVLVIALAVLTGGVVWLLKRVLARRAGARPGAAGRSAQGLPAGWQSRWQPPVSLLPTAVLGTEWLQTTSALSRYVAPSARQEIIRRRQETLDELERRDPAGFARWLAAGEATDSDPARFVRGDRTTGSDAA